MKTKRALTILLLTSLMVCLGCINATGAREPSERFKGYRMQYNKQPSKWVVGNLGKAYVEGDFVSYQARIDKASKLWGATEFSISFNFHQSSSKAIYVDGFDTTEATGFQWVADGDYLPDGQEWPDPAWTHIPTPEAGEPWTSGPAIINYMDAWPPGIGDGTPAGSSPAKERYFTVYDIPWGTAETHIILFFRAHLALDIIWREGLEVDLPTALDGDEFEAWTDSWRGASFATGSSRHFYLQIENVGAKTIPIPIAQYPSTVISGHKFVCGGKTPTNDWEITLTGQLEPGGIPYTPDPVYTGTPPWDTGYFEFTGLIEGSYKVQETMNTPPLDSIETDGDGTNVVTNISEGWVSFDLPQGGTQTVDFWNKGS